MCIITHTIRNHEIPLFRLHWAMCNQDKKLQYYIYVNISEGNGAGALWTISSPNTFTLGMFPFKTFPSALTELNLLSRNQSLCGIKQAKGDGRHPN